MTAFAGQPVRQAGEPAQVGHHDHRPHALALRREPSVGGEDAPAGLRSEIGVEQIAADPAHRPRVDDRRQCRVDLFELGDVGSAEPVRRVGRPGHHRKAAEGAVQRQREIIGAAGLADLFQQRKVEDRAVEAAAHRRAALDGHGSSGLTGIRRSPRSRAGCGNPRSPCDRATSVRRHRGSVGAGCRYAGWRARTETPVAEQPPTQLVEQFDLAVDMRPVDQQPTRRPRRRELVCRARCRRPRCGKVLRRWS